MGPRFAEPCRGPSTTALRADAQDDNAATPVVAQLLLVVFYRLGVAEVGFFGVLAGVDAGAALAQEVPELVELDLDGFEAFAIFFGHFAAVALAHETVLFGDEFFDMRVNLWIGHDASLPFDGGLLPSMNR
jgi:hypothetical protein